jgi:retinol dehydrogenase 12
MNQLPSMKGKVVLITGATDGIGKVTARELARSGARVVIVGRSQSKAAAAVSEISEQTGNAEVEYLLADLSVQDQVSNLAEDFRSRYDRLDVLVNNAGAFFMKREMSQDGFEMTLALNHLAYFMLTLLLVDVIKSSAPARIINVSSGAHYAARIDFDKMAKNRGFSGWQGYGESKLANIYFTYELARRLKGTGVTVNVLHPGFVATRFGMNNSRIGFLLRLFQLGAVTPEQGAETTVFLATSPEVEGVTGKFFVKKEEKASSQVSYDEAAARRLWEMSLEMTHLKADLV